MKHYTFSILILLGIASIAFAWSGPSQSAPNGNTIPINNSSISQTKNGYVWLSDLVSTGSLWSSSTLAIGTSPTVKPESYGLNLLVQGKLQAYNLCDKVGNDCIPQNNLIDPPDFMSDWLWAAAGNSITVNHNLATTNTFVYVEELATSDVGYSPGTQYYGSDLNNTQGFWWSDKTANTIKLNAGTSFGKFFRIMMWKLDGNTRKITNNHYYHKSYPVPSGAIMYFDSTTCPYGWSEFTRPGSNNFFLRGSVAGQPSTDGANSIVLTMSNIPRHRHSYNKQTVGTNVTFRGDTQGNDENNNAVNVQDYSDTNEGTVHYEEGTLTEAMSAAQSVSILPPYYTLGFCRKN